MTESGDRIPEWVVVAAKLAAHAVTFDPPEGGEDGRLVLAVSGGMLFLRSHCRKTGLKRP